MGDKGKKDRKLISTRHCTLSDPEGPPGVEYRVVSTIVIPPDVLNSKSVGCPKNWPSVLLKWKNPVPFSVLYVGFVPYHVSRSLGAYNWLMGGARTLSPGRGARAVSSLGGLRVPRERLALRFGIGWVVLRV